MTVTFTPKTLAGLKPRRARYEVWDALVTGLGVRVQPSGKKTWTVRYRVGRRVRRLTLGKTRVLTLAQAREAARDALRDVTRGHDPAQEKQDRRGAATVAEFVQTYLKVHAKPRKRSWRVDEMRLEKDVLPAWRHRLMPDITRRDVRELLEAITARPAPVVANRVRSLLHKVFNVAIELDVVKANPVTATRPPGVEHARDRVLGPDEIRQLWIASDALTPATMPAAWRLRLLTAQRPGEVSGMRWDDVDLETGWWTIPAGQSKNKLPHRVPLSAPARALLTELRATPRKLPIYVLRGARGKRQQAAATRQLALQNFRGHDLRRTAASCIASAGTSMDVIAKILNHKDSRVTAVYNRHSYDAEKRQALDAWARQLGDLLLADLKAAADRQAALNSWARHFVAIVPAALESTVVPFARPSA